MSERYENGYVALVVALCICIFSIGLTSSLVFYSKGYESADYEHQADRANRDSGEKAYHKCLSANVTIEKARGCIAEHANTTRDAERSEQDLSAQRQMANWAEGMLWATILIGVGSVSVTGLGVYWVRKTFEQGNDLANAALEANNIMRNDQRPWLYCNSAKRIGKEVEFGLRNEGRTPAHSCEIHYNVFYYHPESGLIDSPIPIGGFNKLGSIFPSENAFSVAGVKILEDFEGLHPFKAIHIRGVVTYIDPVSENPKKSPFLFIEVNGEGEFRRYGENNAS